MNYKKNLIYVLSLTAVFVLLFIFFYDFYNKQRDKKIDNKYYKCQTTTINDELDYRRYDCSVKDDYNNYISYSYIQFDDKYLFGNSSNNEINKTIEIYRKSLITKNKKNKFEIVTKNNLNFNIVKISDKNVYNLVFFTTDGETNTLYKSYFLTETNNKFLSLEDIKSIFGINYKLLYSIRDNLIEFYKNNYSYDYLHTKESDRDKFIDSCIQGLDSSNFNAFFVDNDLFNILYSIYIPKSNMYEQYVFVIDKDNKIIIKKYEK